MCRKKQEPFKCDYVPASAAMVFILKHRAIFKFLCNVLLKIRDHTETRARRDMYTYWRRDPNYKLAGKLIQEEFKYKDSYISTGDAVYRFVRVALDHKI